MPNQQNSKENEHDDFMPNPLEPSGPLTGPGWLVEDSAFRGPRLIRISVTDADATDSSSDEDFRYSRYPANVKKVKKYVCEITRDESSSRTVNCRTSVEKMEGKRSKPEVRRREEEEEGGVKKKFRGVRQRKWGKWCAEIRDKASKKRIWLGTYNTAEEAAMKYDQAAIQLHGPNAITNFRLPVPQPMGVQHRPTWLPSDWALGPSSAANHLCYISPTGEIFHSKNEVLHFLKIGSKPKRKVKANGKPPKSVENQVAMNDDQESIKLHGPNAVTNAYVAPVEKKVDSPPESMENATSSVYNPEEELKELEELPDLNDPYISSTSKESHSKGEVLQFLKTGSEAKGKEISPDGKPPESVEHQEGEKPKRKEDTFDFRNPPESVSWIFLNANDDTWMSVTDEKPTGSVEIKKGGNFLLQEST